jgi:putative ABC transport system permease protein
MMDSLLQDCRFAWRGLVRSPGFAAIAIATLALGIGANSAIFTVVNAVVMRPLPYDHPERLVRVTADFTGLRATDVGLSQPELMDYQDRSGLFDAIAGVWAINANLTEIDQPERVETLLASPSYFDVLGVKPQLGRLFGPEDNGPGISTVLVISDALWRRRFGASPDAIGRKLRIDNDWYTVVGVLPPGFRHPGRSVLTDVDVWAPASFVGNPFPPKPVRGAYFITGAIGRLKAGITVEQAQQRLAAFAEGMRQANANDYASRARWAPRLIPLRDDLVGPVKSTLLLVFGAVGFVLLIACANIANLLLARASSRQRELAVRRALGSSRGRMVRLFLTESLLLGALGGLAGAAATGWMLDALLALVPEGLPRLQEVRIDGQVLAFTALTALATAIIFGTLPALQFSKTDVTDALKEGARGTAGARGVVRSALVVAEFALALVLLVGAALLVRSFWALQRVELGFEPGHVLTARLWLPQPNEPSTGPYYSHEARIATYDEILRRARSLPGVSAAAAAGALPFDGGGGNSTFTAEGHESDDRSKIPTIKTTVASTGFFEAMGIHVVRGRSFTDADDTKAQPVAIVTESLAERAWPNEDPIGRRLHFGGPQGRNPWMTVVGVVKDVRTERLEDAARPMLYRPLRQASNLALSVVLKTEADPRTLGSALAAQVRAVDRDLPTYGIRTMDELVARATASRRFSTQLLGAFACLALLLAAVGIYGVMAFVVGQRTREIGIRIALGAHPNVVIRLVLRQALVLAAIGVVFGSAAAIIVTRLLAGLLFEVRATDPSTYGGIALLLGVTAMIAAWLPARRAASVDPILALRSE